MRNVYRNGAAGAASSIHELTIPSKALSDNVATDLLTVTVTNQGNGAVLYLDLAVASGGSDAYESVRSAQVAIPIARTSGVATVATVATLELEQIATVSGGDTFTLSVGVSSITGAVGVTQTFTVQATANSGGGQALVCMGFARLMNLAGGPGITMAAA